MMRKGKRPLVVGAIALTASGAVARVIGTFYRIVLVRAAGEEVLGLFQMAMPVYRLAIGAAEVGFPVAVAQLVADGLGRRRTLDVKAYIRCAIGIVAVLSVLVSVLLWQFAPWIATSFFQDTRLVVPIGCLGILLVPAAICAILRGAVQGFGKVPFIAAANVTEVILRVPGVMALLSMFLPLGAGPAAAAIVVGMVTGEAGSLAVLGSKIRALLANLSLTGQNVTRRPIRYWPYVKTLLHLGVPVMVSGLLNNVMGLVNAAMVPRQLLVSGMTQSEATQAFGQLSGMVVPVLYMPMVLIAPITQVIIPAVAERMAQGKKEGVQALLRKAYLAAGAVGGVSAAFFWLFPVQIGEMLYGAPHIAFLIRPFAIAAPFVFFGTVSSGTLYGLGQTGTVMVNVFLGNLIRYIIISLLVSSPTWGILGAAWALVADCAVTASLNMVSLAWFMRRTKPSAQ